MTAQEAKDYAAMELGYKNFNDAEYYLTYSGIICLINRSLDIMWNAAIDAAAEIAEVFEAFGDTMPFVTNNQSLN